MKTKKIVQVNPIEPEPEIILAAGKTIRNGGVVIFPASCIYGLAASALNEKAVEKVFQIKQRPADNPILILIPDKSMLYDLAASIPDSALKLINAFWPGNLTLVFKAQKQVLPVLTSGTGKIGIRLPGHPVAQALVKNLGFPVTGTSANISSMPGCTTTNDLDPSITDRADLVLDAGTLKGGIGSSIVDVTGEKIIVSRQGAVTEDAIRKALNR
jgi:L-threonylcarbamoyladenylate synthase